MQGFIFFLVIFCKDNLKQTHTFFGEHWLQSSGDITHTELHLSNYLTLRLQVGRSTSLSIVTRKSQAWG